MVETPSTYLSTAEVAQLLHLNEKKIYALAAEGKLPTVRISGKWLFPRDLLLEQLRQQTHVPGEGLLERLLPVRFLIEGSDDLLFREVVLDASRQAEYPVAVGVLGTSGGLRALARQQVHAATVHFPLQDPTAVPQLPEDCALVSLFRRQQGWISRPAQREVGSAAEILEQGLRFADREPDCATHGLACRLFAQAACDLPAYPGRVGPHMTHLGAAAAVESGQAEVTLGIRSAAERCRLAFHPVLDEDFFLALPAHCLAEPQVLRLVDALLESIRRAPAVLATGYDRSCTGTLRRLPHGRG